MWPPKPFRTGHAEAVGTHRKIRKSCFSRPWLPRAFLPWPLPWVPRSLEFWPALAQFPMASFSFRSEATALALLADLLGEFDAFPRASSVWQLRLKFPGQVLSKLPSPRGAVGSTLMFQLSSPRERYFPKASAGVLHPGYPCLDCTQHQQAPDL